MTKALQRTQFGNAAAAVVRHAQCQNSNLTQFSLFDVRRQEDGSWRFSVGVDAADGRRHGIFTISVCASRGAAVEITPHEKIKDEPWVQETIKALFAELEGLEKDGSSFRKVLAVVLEEIPCSYIGADIQLECNPQSSCRIQHQVGSVSVTLSTQPKGTFWLASIGRSGVGSNGDVDYDPIALQKKLHSVLEFARQFACSHEAAVKGVHWRPM